MLLTLRFTMERESYFRRGRSPLEGAGWDTLTGSDAGKVSSKPSSSCSSSATFLASSSALRVEVIAALHFSAGSEFDLAPAAKMLDDTPLSKNKTVTGAEGRR